MNDFDPKRLRAAFARYMTGVTVVTARDARGEPAGFTANSFTSVSLDPPLLLVCPGRHLSSFAVFQSAPCFGVSILAEGQEVVSNLFAGRAGDRFARCGWEDGALGVPLISGRAAGFSCATHDRVEAGDHLILIGRIEAFDHSDANGLGYGPSGYFSLGKEREAMSATASRTRASVLLDDGRCVYLTEDGDLPTIEASPDHDPLAALRGYLAAQGIAADPGVVYSIYDEGNATRRLVFRARLAAPTPELVAKPIHGLNAATVPDPAVHAMLSRFETEFQNQSFGLYVGDDRRGDILPGSDPGRGVAPDGD